MTQWDSQNKGTRTSPVWLSFVLKVPLRHLHPSVIYSVPCDRILQMAYYWYFHCVWGYHLNCLLTFLLYHYSQLTLLLHCGSAFNNYVRLLLLCVYGTTILNNAVLCHAIEEIKLRSHNNWKNTLQAAPKQVNRLSLDRLSLPGVQLVAILGQLRLYKDKQAGHLGPYVAALKDSR